MSNREEILSLNNYSSTVDTADLEDFAKFFENGDWYIEGSPPNNGSEEIQVNVISQMIIYEDGTPRTRHLNTNIEL